MKKTYLLENSKVTYEGCPVDLLEFIFYQDISEQKFCEVKERIKNYGFYPTETATEMIEGRAFSVKFDKDRLCLLFQEV